MELIDRYTIAQVKYDRTGGENQAELDFYEQQMSGIDKILIWTNYKPSKFYTIKYGVLKMILKNLKLTEQI